MILILSIKNIPIIFKLLIAIRNIYIKYRYINNRHIMAVAENTLMQVENLDFFYNKGTDILKGIDLHVNPGEIIGISGENGSGKSTLLKLLVGLLVPKNGRIDYEGRIGYSPQNLLLFENLTTLENFEVFGKGMGLSIEDIHKQAEVILEKLNFSKYRDTMVKNLSGGTAQKVNFGISLLGDPDILVLDEPYQGMDYGSFSAFWDIQFDLREEGKAIIIVSHMIEDQSKFSKSYHLINGKLQHCDRKDCPQCSKRHQEE